LIGADLVRLGLEQSKTAHQAVNLLTRLIENHGQGSGGCEGIVDADSAFIVADPIEAYILETAGRYWVCQEIHELRAQSEVRVVRQDWDHISRGLADVAMNRGWWSCDGSKIDFAGIMGELSAAEKAALRQWSRATLLLQEQNGSIDLGFIRRIIGGEPREDSHDEPPQARGNTIVASFAANLSSDPAHAPMAWCALGSGSTGLFFPVFLEGELPNLLCGSRLASTAGFQWRTDSANATTTPHKPSWTAARDNLVRLQTRIDQETDEFLLEYAVIKGKGYTADVERQTSLFMEHHAEQVEEALCEAVSATAAPLSVD
jgi:hypothetical protein